MNNEQLNMTKQKNSLNKNIIIQKRRFSVIGYQQCRSSVKGANNLIIKMNDSERKE